ncbi:hypothetical protein LXM50_08330 [Microbacterium sp. Au-Mic1]|nr:hypothetical protein [Microbacterium sp. Au-Mic1]MCE4025978.1 hypothetical protein [Microbacterium sp. Au-Mic1]
MAEPRIVSIDLTHLVEAALRGNGGGSPTGPNSVDPAQQRQAPSEAPQID